MIRFAVLALFGFVAVTMVPASQAAPIIFTAVLDGPSESPPVPSPGTGSATVEFDIAAHTLRVAVSFTDLIGFVTSAHIHGPTAMPGMGIAGIATTAPTFPGFPFGVASGTYDMTFDTTEAGTFNPSFVAASGGTVAGAELALFTAMMDGKAYLNIHTTFFGSGEIRGFLEATSIAEPSAAAALAVGLAGLLIAGRIGGAKRASRTWDGSGPGPSRIRRQWLRKI